MSTDESNSYCDDKIKFFLYWLNTKILFYTNLRYFMTSRPIDTIKINKIITELSYFFTVVINEKYIYNFFFYRLMYSSKTFFKIPFTTSLVRLTQLCGLNDYTV